MKRKLFTLIMSICLIFTMMPISAYAAESEYDAILKVVPDKTSFIADGTNDVQVKYTISVVPKSGIKIGAISFKLAAPEGMTLGTEYETGYTEEDLKYDKRTKKGIFDVFAGYDPDNGQVYSATGTTEDRCITAEQKLMTIRATIAADKIGKVSLAITNLALGKVSGDGNWSSNADVTPVEISRALSGETYVPITAPVKNAVPQTSITDTSGRFTGTIAWEGNPDKFAAGTVYKANVTMTANDGYIFASDFVPSFLFKKVSNKQVSADGKTVTFTAEFAETASKDTPTVKTAPTATVTYKDAVSKDAIQGGVMELNGTVVPGTFAWKNLESYGDAGTKTLESVFTPNDTENYQAVTVPVNVTVNRKTVTNPTIVVEGSYDYKYGNPVVPTTVVVKDGDEIIPESEYTLAYSNNTDAGTAKVTVVDTGTGNYALVGNLEQTYTINQITGTLGINPIANITYDGEPVQCKALTDSDASKADIAYHYNGDGRITVSWYSDNNGSKGEILTGAPTNAGTYWVGVSASGGRNYKDIAEVTSKFTITGKAIEDIVKNAVKGNIVTYNGEAQAAVTVDTTKTEGYTIKYKTSENGTYEAGIPMVTNVSDSKTIYVEISRENYQTYTTTVYAEVKPAKITGATAVAEKTYTGSLLTFEVTEVRAGKLILTTNDYDVFDNKATDAGDNYEMTITGKGNYTGEHNQPFKISPATITNNGAFADYAAAYDGKEHGIVYDPAKLSAVGNQPLTVKYKKWETSSYSTTAPTFIDVTDGPWTVYWQVTAPNHEPLTGSNTVNITKAQIDVSSLKWVETAEFDFNNELQGVQLVNVPTSIVIDYTDNAGRYVGTYTATAEAKAVDSTNCEVTGTIKNKTWKIKPINQTPTITEARTITKGGNTLYLNTLVSGAQGEISFALVGTTDAATLDGSVLTTADDKTGEVVLNVSIAAKDLNGDGTAEYNAYRKDNAIKITVTDKEVKELTVNQSGWTFGDAAQEPIYKAPSGVQTTTVKYSGTAKDGTVLTDSETAPTKAGDYTVTVSCETATEIYTGSKEFTIAQKSINGAEIELGTALTYTSAEQTQTVSSVKLKDITLAESTDYTVSANTGTNAGSYTLSISGQNNYTGTLTKSFTIAKKEIAITGASFEERAYAAGQKDVKVTAVAFGDATLTRGVDYRATGVMADDNAGTDKEVTVTVELWNDNYKLAVNTAKANVNIAKAVYGTQNLNSAATKGTSAVYDLSKYLKDGYDIQSITADSGVIAGTPEVKDGKLSYTVTDSAASAGVITIKVKATNYADYEIKLTVNVTEKLVPELKVSDIEVTYTGMPITAEAIKGTATVDGKTVEGTWSFDSSEDLTAVNGGKNVKVTFTPNDETYAAAVTTIKVTINKAKVTGAPKLPTVNAEGKTLGEIKADAASGFGVEGTFTWDDGDNAPIKKGAKYGWTFTPNDSNYATVTGTVAPWADSSSGGGGGGGFVIPSDTPEKVAKDFIKDNMTINGEVVKAADAENYEKVLEASDKYDKLSTAEKAAVDKEMKAQTGKTMAELKAEAEAIKASIGTSTFDVQKAVKELTLKARSAKLKSGNIKITLKGDISEFEKNGYTVKYKFYRSTKKAKGYKAAVTKDVPNYLNTAGKKGTMYYYKARVMVYDKDGKLVAKTELKQCKYANRKWTKK